jgi:hypothetical protein
MVRGRGVKVDVDDAAAGATEEGVCVTIWKESSVAGPSKATCTWSNFLRANACSALKKKSKK